MISVKKDFTKAPASLLSETCLSKIKDCIDGKSYIESDWYKQKDTKKQLKEIYNNKCAYCEGYSSAQAPFHIEHYRPKNEVTVKVNGKKIKVAGHKGYYWLAYNWSNLLWSCFWCNQNKSSLFPLEDETNRIFNPPLKPNGNLNEKQCESVALKSETPLILNPEIDKPENHFYFKRNGKIKNISKIGKATISICALNREDLQLARRKLVDDFYANIVTEVTDYLDDENEVDFLNFKRNIKNIISKIYRRTEPQNDYSWFGYFMFTKFEYFFIKKSDFDKETKNILLKIYNELASKAAT